MDPDRGMAVLGMAHRLPVLAMVMARRRQDLPVRGGDEL